VHFFALDFTDLTTIKKAADEFLSRESKLHVLWHNAGVMIPPQGSKTKQGYELQLGTHNVGPTLLTKFLYPALKNAAAEPGTAKDSVRVVWVSSVVVSGAPTPAIDFDNLDYHVDEGAWVKYRRSKAGNILQAVAFAERAKDDGIASVVGVAIQPSLSMVLYLIGSCTQTLDPGVAMTNLQRTMPGWLQVIVVSVAGFYDCCKCSI
jgi:NAD(P)-dependent dehydrogenase (short-subunit alcohol dehydrogenase family)